jgi:hypothetical protein
MADAALVQKRSRKRHDRAHALDGQKRIQFFADRPGLLSWQRRESGSVSGPKTVAADEGRFRGRWFRSGSDPLTQGWIVRTRRFAPTRPIVTLRKIFSLVPDGCYGDTYGPVVPDLPYRVEGRDVFGCAPLLRHSANPEREITVKEERKQEVRPDWLSLSEARRRLGISRPAIRKLAKNGLVGTLLVPGVPAKVNATDIAKLAKESVRPARSL